MSGVEQSLEAGKPLKPAWFHVLLALGDGEGHGFAIRERVEARTGGRMKLWPATLYGTIRQLTERSLIEALEGDEDPDGDGRRRYYRLTVSGRQALQVEADRLESLARDARAAGAGA
jgi:DNA-binding PadR family transcriptional regulator